MENKQIVCGPKLEQTGSTCIPLGSIYDLLLFIDIFLIQSNITKKQYFNVLLVNKFTIFVQNKTNIVFLYKNYIENYLMY